MLSSFYILLRPLEQFFRLKNVPPKNSSIKSVCCKESTKKYNGEDEEGEEVIHLLLTDSLSGHLLGTSYLPDTLVDLEIQEQGWKEEEGRGAGKEEEEEQEEWEESSL